jgi:hypothetical protein
MNTKHCEHPSDRADVSAEVAAGQRRYQGLLMECPDCGAECSGTHIGDDRLCYDEQCPLHQVAGVRRVGRGKPSPVYIVRFDGDARGQGFRDTSTGRPTLFDSLADAQLAIARQLGWESVVLSDDYASTGPDGRETTGWSAYETTAEMEADQAGCSAPQIVRVNPGEGK